MLLRSFPVWLVAALSVSAFSACGGSRSLPDRPLVDAPDGRDPASARPGGTVRSETAGLLGRDIGLETQIWTTDTPDAMLADALAPFVAEPLPFAPAAVTLWRANGFRIVAIPLDSLPAVQSSLEGSPSARGADRQWLGQPTRWTTVHRGPASTDPRVLVMDSGRVPLPPGRFRLVLRGWISPQSPDDAPVVGAATVSAVPPSRVPASLVPRPPRPVLNIELVPQYQESARRPGADVFDVRPPTLDELDEGQVFDRLALVGAMNGLRAILIVPEHPEADWSSLSNPPNPPIEPIPTDPADDRATAPAVGRVTRAPDRAVENRSPTPRASVSPAGPRPSGQGPAASVLPTLGSAILSTDWANPAPAVPAPRLGESPSGAAAASTAAPRRRRSLIVFIPRLPERYTLLGD